MRKAASYLLVAVLLQGCSGPGAEEVILPAVVDYNFHIKPILSDRCYACHGPDEKARQASLKLHEEAGAKRAVLESGSHAIVPGSLRRSKLYRRITARDTDERMPPAESNLSLSSFEIALIGRWIQQGAEWKPHWAFIRPAKPPLPAVQDAAWPTSGIDHFVLARLEREGLSPSAEAARETLIRRVTFDLTGLPPSLDDIDAFVADSSVDAYERVVDRLLNSEAYGEHMAAEWLDIARYADTHGYQNDRERRMWPWRDWVIDALNANMSFDAFSTWQLAGDLMPDATVEQQLATAFNRNHRQTNEGGSIEEEFRTEYVADRTNTVGTAFLGLTMECARCHDHKYDPITQQDYYSLFSLFNNIDESGQTSHFTQAVPVPALPLPDAAADAQIRTLQAQVDEQERMVRQAAEAARSMIEAWTEHGAPLVSVPPPILAYDFDVLQDDRMPATLGPEGQAVFAPTLVEGRHGQALSFDGESGINIPEAGRFARSDPFTISFWIKAAEAHTTCVLVHRTQAALDAGSRGYEVSLQDGLLLGQLAHMWPENALRITTDAPVPVGRWVHVAMTYDGSSTAQGLRLFVDGVQAQTTTVRDNLQGPILYENLAVPFTIGYRFRDTGFKGGAIDALRIYDSALPALDVRRLAGLEPGADEADRSEYYLARLGAEHVDQILALQSRRAALNAARAAVPQIMVMREMSMNRAAHVLVRGQYDAKGARVDPGAPEAIMPWSDKWPRNRYGLAQWLFDPDNPLTARVAVNRFWQRYFGTGLVATPEDFGSQGALPSHPDLLDYLATTFIQSGWDMKDLHRRIVTSRTYRQRSSTDPATLARDPANTLLARGPRLRLSAEMVRDHALAASGLLDRTVGGPSVKPYQPDGLWEEKSGVRYVMGTGPDLYRRSLYTFFKRTSPPPSMITFDMPTRAQCVMRRQQTTTPMQALVLLNDPQYVEAARHIAQRTMAQPSLEARITRAFRLVTSRYPTGKEIEVLQALYQEQHAFFEADAARAPALLTTGQSAWDAVSEPSALAAMAVLSSALLSYDEAIMRY